MIQGHVTSGGLQQRRDVQTRLTLGGGDDRYLEYRIGMVDRGFAHICTVAPESAFGLRRRSPHQPLGGDRHPLVGGRQCHPHVLSPAGP